jgi:hypothetical protein
MEKWEYLILTAFWSNGWKVRTVNGRTVANWREGPSVFDAIAILGDQGWEMVQMQFFSTFDQSGRALDVEGSQSYRAAFKRRKA